MLFHWKAILFNCFLSRFLMPLFLCKRGRYLLDQDYNKRVSIYKRFLNWVYISHPHKAHYYGSHKSRILSSFCFYWGKSLTFGSCFSYCFCFPFGFWILINLYGVYSSCGVFLWFRNQHWRPIRVCMGKERTIYLRTPFKTHFASSISRRHLSLSSHFQCQAIWNAEVFLNFHLKGEEKECIQWLRGE